MEYKEFFKKIARYYGSYSSNEKAQEIYRYVFDNIPQGRLEYLYKNVLQKFSSKWRVPPDIGVFADCLELNSEEIRAMDRVIERIEIKPMLEHKERRMIE